LYFLSNKAFATYVSISEKVVLAYARLRYFQEQDRSSRGLERVFHACGHGQTAALAQYSGLAVNYHTDPALHDKKGLVLEFMVVVRTFLAVKDEQKLAAIASLFFVGYPKLYQADLVEISEPEIYNQRSDPGHFQMPLGQLLTEPCQCATARGWRQLNI
jgi:hypothetical protein